MTQHCSIPRDCSNAIIVSSTVLFFVRTLHYMPYLRSDGKRMQNEEKQLS